MNEMTKIRKIKPLAEEANNGEGMTFSIPEGGKTEALVELYGKNVFSLKVMRNHLSEKAFQSISATIRDGGRLDPDIADEVAEAMKNWAVSKGETHFTHWFQPMTNTTAEKHDSFISWNDE